MDKFYTISVCTDAGRHVSFRRLQETEARNLWQVLNLAQLVRSAASLPNIEARLERWSEGDELPEPGTHDTGLTGVETKITLRGLTPEQVGLLLDYANDANAGCKTKTYWASMQYFDESMRMVGAMDTVMKRHPVRFVADLNAQDLPNKAFLCSWQEVDHLTYAALKEAYDFANTDKRHDASA